MICTDTDHYVNTLSTIKKEKEKKGVKGLCQNLRKKSRKSLESVQPDTDIGLGNKGLR